MCVGCKIPYVNLMSLFMKELLAQMECIAGGMACVLDVKYTMK